MTTSETAGYPPFESQPLLSQFNDFLLQCATLKLSQNNSEILKQKIIKQQNDVFLSTMR